MNISSLYAKYTRDEKIKCMQLCKDAGFDAVDFSLCEMVEDGSEFNRDDYREVALKYRKAADDMGLAITQTHTPFRFKNWDDEENYKNVIFPRIVRSLEISALLGAEVAVVHPLHHMEYHGSEEEIFEINMAFYKSLIPYCREFGIKCGVENMWRHDPRRRYITHDTCSRKEEFVRYVDTLDSEYMIACLDVGHVGLPMQDDEAHDFVRYLGHDRLQSLHIHDNDYKGDQHIMPYAGKMNWTELAKALGEIDYTGDFTYELNGSYLDTADDEFAPVIIKYAYDVARHLADIIDRNRPHK
ncbi:MAG: sugar phosphate isomerase/epimerase [Clostridia bacterium]|nr:sugar phosphate isomerase/epimerase [Clostridia bacterium]